MNWRKYYEVLVDLYVVYRQMKSLELTETVGAVEKAIYLTLVKMSQVADEGTGFAYSNETMQHVFAKAVTRRIVEDGEDPAIAIVEWREARRIAREAIKPWS